MIPIVNQYEDLFPFFAGTMCLLPVVWFIVAILIAIWVYRDAEKRGMGGALWLIICLVGGIIGLIIYLIVRKDKVSAGTMPSGSPTTQYCKYCRAPLSPDSKFCPNCGKEQT